MRRPNALQMRVLDELAGHPYGGVNDRDLALRLRVRSVYSSLRVCEREGWAALYSAGYDGGLRWTHIGPHSRKSEPTTSDEWTGWFWMLTDEGNKALCGEYLRQQRQAREQRQREWADGEAERLAEATKAGGAG